MVIRKSIAFNKNELNEFDKAIRNKGYKNRSEAVRDLIRLSLIEEETKNPNKVMMGVLTIVYNHHDHDVQHNLTHIQHHHPSLVITSLHNHLNNDNCMEILVLQGKVKNLILFSDKIKSTKGVKHGTLIFSAI